MRRDVPWKIPQTLRSNSPTVFSMYFFCVCVCNGEINSKKYFVSTVFRFNGILRPNCQDYALNQESHEASPEKLEQGEAHPPAHFVQTLSKQFAQTDTRFPSKKAEIGRPLKYLNQRGTKIRVFRVCFRTPFRPPFSPHFPTLFPLQALFTLTPLLPSSPPPLPPLF